MNIIVTTEEQLTQLIHKAVSGAMQTDVKKDEVNTVQASEGIYLTPDEVCELLKINPSTLWSWDKKGITKPLRIGNLKRYLIADIKESFKPI